MSMNSFHSRSRRAAPAARPATAPVDHGGLVRVDALLVERGLCASRTRARAAIAAGRVLADGTRIAKPAHLLQPDARLVVLPDEAGMEAQAVTKSPWMHHAKD